MFCLVKVTGISEDQLLVSVLPGLPTAAEFFIVPDGRSREGTLDGKWAHLDQVLYHKTSLSKAAFTNF